MMVKLCIQIPRWGAPPEVAGYIEYDPNHPERGFTFTAGAWSIGALRDEVEIRRPKGMNYETYEAIMRTNAELMADLPRRVRTQSIWAEEVPDDDG
jgi:hypothetical protein